MKPYVIIFRNSFQMTSKLKMCCIYILQKGYLSFENASTPSETLKTVLQALIDTCDSDLWHGKAPCSVPCPITVVNLDHSPHSTLPDQLLF